MDPLPLLVLRRELRRGVNIQHHHHYANIYHIPRVCGNNIDAYLNHADGGVMVINWALLAMTKTAEESSYDTVL